MPIHLRPSAPTAEAAIVCGDPARALAIAQRVLEAPRMSNHHRGLWGYHGATRAGYELTVQATGIGGPSAAVVLHELAELGARRIVRVGTAAATAAEPPIASLHAIEAAIAADGTSVALGARPGEPLPGDPALTAALAADADGAAHVISSDLHSRDDPRGLVPGALGAAAPPLRDMQTATLFAAARALDLRAAAILLVAFAEEGRLEDDPLDAAAGRAADAAARVLSTST
jgi:uridine phosphorylase